MQVDIATHPSTSGSHADAYLFIQGKRQGAVKGEAASQGHKEEIQVSGWRWRMAQSGSHGSHAATGRRVYEALVVDKMVDRASTALMNAMASSEELKTVRLALRKAGTEEDDFFTIELERARVSSLEIQARADGALVETLQIAFSKVTVSYHVQAATGIRGGVTVFTDELSAE